MDGTQWFGPGLLHRAVVTIVAALAVLAGLLLAPQPASAQPARSTYPGEPGTIVDRSGDGFIPSLRYRGAQRFDTARLIAEDTFEDAETVLLARADLFPDAMAGSYLAGQLSAPLLLTETTRLTSDTEASLRRLAPSRVIILGGTSAIDDTVITELEAQSYDVERVSGIDRFATARRIATRSGGTVGEHDGQATAIVARADEFPDALVAGSVSYAAEFPLLLTTGNTLHPDARAGLDELAIAAVIIPGGTAAVSEAVADEIRSMGIAVERVFGIDRVATSVEFAYFARDELGFSLDHLNLAVGSRFPDALTIGPHAGDEGNPIVLTASPTVLGGADSVERLLSETCQVSLLHVAGGHAAISTDLEQQMRQFATSTGGACDVVVDDEDRLAVNQPGTSHTVDVTVTDNVGGPPESPATVRFQVFRGPLGLPPGEVVYELVQEATDVTASDGSAQFTYTGPDTEARDYIIACTQLATGAEVDTCVEPVAGQVDDILLVSGGTPQNVRDDVAFGVAIKDWDAGAPPPAPASLTEVEFCDNPTASRPDPCEPYDAFGDHTGDFLRLTFTDALAPLGAGAELQASVTLTSGDGEIVFQGQDAVAFVTANELDDNPLPGDVGQIVDDLNDNQLLIVVDVLLGDPPVVPGALDEFVVGLTGIDDANGLAVSVPPSGVGIDPFQLLLPL